MQSGVVPIRGPESAAALRLNCEPVRVGRSNPAMPQYAPPRLEERVAELERQCAELHQSLSEANWVHQQLCAPRHLRRGRFEIASEMFPVRHLGGDFFCINDTGTHDLTLAIGDIAGKGAAAGMWITLFAGLFQIHATPSADPAAALAPMNRNLCLLQPARPLATMFLARLDWQRGTVAYCSAGHPPALLLRAGGGVDCLEEGGPILGAVPDATFRSASVTLQPDDTLLAYSDGLLETRNAEGQEFGIERLVREARRCLPCSAGEMVFSLLARVRDFAGRQMREDNVSVVVLRDAGARGETSGGRAGFHGSKP